MSNSIDPSANRPLTVDGEIGLSDEDASKLARNFFFGGFLALPWLWFVNCYFFWPVLRHGGDPAIRKYVIGSGIGFILFTSILAAWSLTFSIGGEALLGSSLWSQLSVFALADKMQMWLTTTG